MTEFLPPKAYLTPKWFGKSVTHKIQPMMLKEGEITRKHSTTEKHTFAVIRLFMQLVNASFVKAAYKVDFLEVQ